MHARSGPRPARLDCLPKLRMTGMVREPFWEPDQPSRTARQRTATAFGRSAKREERGDGSFGTCDQDLRIRRLGAPGTGLSTKAVRGVRGPELRRPSAHVHAPINAQPMALLRSSGAKGVRAPNLDPMRARRPQLTITECFYAIERRPHTRSLDVHTPTPPISRRPD